MRIRTRKESSTRGYRKQMLGVRRRLRELGITEALFDADFAAQESRNREGVDAMLERLTELEKDPEWNPAGLPWREALTPAPEDVVTQSRMPRWLNPMKIAVQDWQTNLPEFTRRRRAGIRSCGCKNKVGCVHNPLS